MMRLVHPPEEADPIAPSCGESPVLADGDAWPAEVDMILSAMEAAQPMRLDRRDDGRRDSDRRDADRSPHHTRAELRLFAHDPLSPTTALFTRDISPAGMGFITRDRLPLGYGGVVTFHQEDGTKVATACTIFRCREAVNGWFEGALHFSS